MTVRLSVPGTTGTYLDADLPIITDHGLVRVDLGAVHIIGPAVEVHDLFIKLEGRLAKAVVHTKLPQPEEQ